MQPYAEMNTEELQELRKQLSAKYKEFQGKDLRLDMSRGKPSAAGSFHGNDGCIKQQR